MIAAVAVPDSIAALLLLASAVGAVSLILGKIGPTWRKTRRLDAKLAMLNDLTEQWADVPEVLLILREIVGQVRNNSGSSLLDTIQRVDNIAHELAQAARVQAANNAAVLILLERLTMKVDAGAATALRVETAGASAAARSEATDADVAAALAAAQGRADETVGDAGEAADAYSRSDPAPDPESGG